MKKSYVLITTICLSLMTAVSHAENIQNVAPPATPPKDSGMKHDMGGMGMQHDMGGMGGMGMKHGMGGGMGMQHGMGGGMGGMMAGMTDEEKEQHMRGMQEHMLKMHDLSNQILAEKDPTKKEALKKQQLDLMKAHHAQMMESHHPKK
jgi:hypothetical protein